MRRGGHAPSSTGTYIRGYERVKLLLMQGTPVHRIAPLLGMQPGVVQEYAALVFQYHPHLLPDEVSPPLA